MSRNIDPNDPTIAAIAKKLGVPLSDLLKKEVHVADVVRHGQKITLPEGMAIDEAMDVLKRRKVYEEQLINVSRTFDFFYLDGAYAMLKVLEAKYGWAQQQGSWFSDPEVRQIQISATETVSVSLGEFTIPNIPGSVHAGLDHKNHQHVFLLNARVPRMYEAQIRELGDEIEKYVQENSIFKGKSLRLKLSADDMHGCGAMPDPEFIDLSKVKPEELIFSDEVEASIATNVYTPIDYYATCKSAGIPFKRTVLFAGTYGTGKTLAAMVTAYKANEAGITFIYCESADQIVSAIQFARQYGRAVIFCEDIDKVVSGERDTDMDEILNIIDGVESKGTDIMIILTTNEVEKINPAMIRPGRLDAIIPVTPPDSVAVQKLVRLYGRGLVPENADLTEVGRRLKGQIPAVIREAVERAKLSAIRFGSVDDFGRITLRPEALIDAANSMALQLQLLNHKVEREPSDMERAATIFVTAFQKSIPTNGNGTAIYKELPALGTSEFPLYEKD